MIAETTNPPVPTMESAIGSIDRSLAHYLESQASLWDSYVDPREAYLGNDGELWQGIDGGVTPYEELPFRTTVELFQVQSQARILFRDNEFAKNAHRNRQNYIIGEGHKYVVVGKHEGAKQESIHRVQTVLDDILNANRWGQRQREIKLRDDRDGETFIRKFADNDGIMKFRFVEPRQVQDPPNAKPYQSYGVETKEDDCETPYAYWIDGKPVPAELVQHRKWNVDSSIKRGFPLLFPVRHNLRRAVKLLRNMSIATEIQTAIALIRKHQQATKEVVRTFLNAKGEQQRQPGGQQRQADGRTDNVMRYAAGSILDASAGIDYTIAPQLDPSKTVAALQAELRAIASLLVMPEFMLTSDASNANFASTMVAEGPAVKNFQAEQSLQAEHDLELLNDALRHAADSGLITQADLEQTKLDVEPPSVITRDILQEAQARQIDMGLGILSPQTATAMIGQDYDQEQTNIEVHAEKSGAMPFGLAPAGAGDSAGGPPGDGLPDDPNAVSATALNGIQITSLKAIISEVAGGLLPTEAGRELIFASFPMMPPDQVDRLLASVQGASIPLPEPVT